MLARLADSVQFNAFCNFSQTKIKKRKLVCLNFSNHKAIITYLTFQKQTDKYC